MKRLFEVAVFDPRLGFDLEAKSGLEFGDLFDGSKILQAVKVMATFS